MILRRLSQNLKAQNWTAIVIEFILLVSGVFLGIQVSNWNEDRASARQAVDYTERLTDDLRKEAWGYESTINYNRQTNANQRRVLDAMAGDIMLSDEAFVISAYRATQYKDYTRYRATFDELVSTGTIGLVSNRALRETAVQLFTTAFMEEFSLRTKNSEYRRLFREIVSAPIQEALLLRCGDREAPELDYIAIEKQLDYPCTLDLPAEKIRAAAEALKAEPRLVPALQVRFADNQTALSDLQQVNRNVLENLRAIGQGKNAASGVVP